MPDHPQNARAILLIVLSMAGFAGVDTFVKLVSVSQGAGQILFISSAAAFFGFWGFSIWAGQPLISRLAFHPALVIRSSGEVVGSIGIVMALTLAPLSSTMALAQAQPLAVVAGAALFLGEDVGWRRWAAVGLGLVGVLIIMRPGFGAFDPNLLWVIPYIFGLATRDLASRRLPQTITSPFAVAWSMLPMTLAGAIMVPFQGGWQAVGGETALYYVAMVGFMFLALWTITSAMRIGDASAVAPFRYSRIVFALLIAYIVFDERPDLMTFLGAGLIVGSGIYTFWRERQRAQTQGI